MIINNMDSKKVKILIDENDLKKSNIQVEEWLGSPHKINVFLNKLLNSNISYTDFKDFNIFTYNFKVYSIEIKF